MPEKRQKNGTLGFTLVEILIALAITSILTTAIYQFFIGQHHAYTVQDQVIEMEQNARAAMDMIRRELRMAGYHAMGNELLINIPSFVPSDILPDSPIPVTLGNKSIKITKGSGGDPDMITFLTVLPEHNNLALLGQKSEVGDEDIILEAGQGEEFRIGDMIHIGTCSEYARVTEITGDTLSVDVISANQKILQIHEAKTPVSKISVVSYALIPEEDGTSVLKRNARDNSSYNVGFQPVAENITDMEIDRDDTTGEILITLASQTDRPDHKFQPNNGYRTYTANARIMARNAGLDGVDVGSDCPLPAAPATVSLAGLDETRPCDIDITWDAVTVSETDCEVTGYKVFYSTSSNGFYDGSVDVGDVTAYTLDVTGLNACDYYIAVAAVNSAGTGAKSDPETIPDESSPADPTWITSFPAENINGVERKVVLSWNKNTECDLQGYNIEKKLESDSDINYEQISDSIISKELDTYTDIDFGTPTAIEEIDCQTYAYRIRAEDYCSPSGWSIEETAGPTAPAPPTGPVFETDGTRDTLSWTLSTDDFIGLNDLNYIKEYHVEYTPVTPEGSPPVVVTLDAGTSTWTSPSSNSYYEVSAFDACGNESEKLSFSSSCINTLPGIAITAPSENDSVSGTETISGTATAAESDRTITKVRLKIDDTAWVDVSGTDSWSYDWNTRGEAEGAHTIIVGAYDSNDCYTQASVSVSVSNTDVIIGDLACKLFGCGGTDEYAYLLAYVYDATNNLPVSDAAIKSDVAVGPNFYELLPTNELGYYGGDLTPPCTMETDDNGTPVTNNIAVKTQQKFRSGTITVTVKKDNQEDTCSWTLSDGSAQ